MTSTKEKVESYLNELNEKKESNNCTIMRKFAIENDFPIISYEGKRFLSQIIKLSNVKNVLEIGTAIAYSAISMAEIGCNVTTIEINEETYKIAKENIKTACFENEIKVFNEDALELDINKVEGLYDLIFIDAAKSQYTKFLEKYSPLLKKGGIIFTDNLIFHGRVVEERIESKNLRQLIGKIKRFNKYISENEAYDSHIYNIGDGICISIKK